MMHALRIKFSFVSICSGRFLKHSFVVLSGPPFLWFCWCWMESDSSLIVKSCGRVWFNFTGLGCCSWWEGNWLLNDEPAPNCPEEYQKPVYRIVKTVK